MNTIGIVIVIAIVAILAVGLTIYLKQRSVRLRQRFGPEYTRALEETGNKYKAESKLEKLEKRVDKFSVHPLKPDEAIRFRDSWRVIQAGFVDDPKSALSAADDLVGEVMNARGYPVADFDERASEISVNHALVVENYRAGHEIALKHSKGQATTEDMRRGMIHYRTLFDDLLGLKEAARAKAAGSST
ncbi:MAG TPA: hypothetical protein VFE02_19330 [Candidatus Acidoferrales bacterium]|jgi:hypothetical protein|nr:hypothetical protein [Candidatus Acidoferrales bacterium]